MERAERLHRRRVVRLHARHAGEPGGLPAAARRRSPGIGFPLARVAVLLSLATGACHDLAIAPYAGKGTGETTLLRRMYDSLKPGDVVLADALFDNYFLACELRERGIESGRARAGGAGGEPDGGGPARRRHHPLAAAQQAARDDRASSTAATRRSC